MKTETIQIDKKNAINAYNKANGELKDTLGILFGEHVVKPDPMDAFKTWDDVAAHMGIISLPFSTVTNKIQLSINGLFKLEYIYAAFNEGWEPDYTNTNQYKYYPWFDFNSARSAFVYTYSAYAVTYTRLGSRLCTDTETKAAYIGKQFADIFNEAFNPTL